jgi:hypothetical protein
MARCNWKEILFSFICLWAFMPSYFLVGCAPTGDTLYSVPRINWKHTNFCHKIFIIGETTFSACIIMLDRVKHPMYLLAKSMPLQIDERISETLVSSLTLTRLITQDFCIFIDHEILKSHFSKYV